MSFNIKNSFVSRAIVEDDKQLDTVGKEEEAVVIQEQYDPRTLYERLQEQKALKEEKFAEESRLSNHIKRVDEEEAEYFKILSDEKEKLEYERKVKEQLELEEYRQAVEARITPAGVPVATVNTKINTKKAGPTPTITKNNIKSVKGALFIKKKKREHESSDDDELEDKKDNKKIKTTSANTTIVANKGSLSLLSATYGDISSSSDNDSDGE